jgi:hypothetical protein
LHALARAGGGQIEARRGQLRLLALVCCAVALVAARPSSARAAANPIGAHSMLQLNSPQPFMQAMFAEAARMHASAIRLDVAPANPHGLGAARVTWVTLTG